MNALRNSVALELAHMLKTEGAIKESDLTKAGEELERLHAECCEAKRINAVLVEALEWALACIDFDEEDMPDAFKEKQTALKALQKAKQ
jgi:hypothetical protein